MLSARIRVMSELLHNFGVDWKLLIAQAINFFVLFAVLWKFAYKPILEVFRTRRKSIAQGLRDAEEASQRLIQADKIGEEKITEARSEAFGIVSHAEALGKKRKEEILQEAADKGEVVIAEAHRRAEEERLKAEEAFYKDAEDLLRKGMEKVLLALPAEARDRELTRRAIGALKAAAKS